MSTKINVLFFYVNPLLWQLNIDKLEDLLTRARNEKQVEEVFISLFLCFSFQNQLFVFSDFIFNHLKCNWPFSLP